ncbi:MAG: radical SAM family protein [Saccharofermentanales bacterium]
MINKGLGIVNHNVPCSCACKYCFFRSCKKAYGIPYYRGEKIALRFNEWRKEKMLTDFSLNYSISHCADYPELVNNIELNKLFGFTGYMFLQINGIDFKNKTELAKYFKNIKKAGVTNIDTTFYGLENYHDKFAARKGDFKYLFDIISASLDVGLASEPTFVILEENKNQLDELIFLLKNHIGNDVKIHGFLQDFRGNGEYLEGARLLRQSYDSLSDKVKNHINISRYKTENEWLKDNNFIQFSSRNLVLALRPDNIDMLEQMSCEEIINYIIDLDENYYNLIPSVEILAKSYGRQDCQKLYRQRDLHWKWQKQFIKDNKIVLHDVTDERLCGSYRY